MSPVDSLPAAPRGPVSREAARIAAALRVPSPRIEPARLDVPRAERPRANTARLEVLAFSLGGMRFALSAAQIVETMTVAGARLERILAMAETGTLGSSGLPLIRLSQRMGIAASAANGAAGSRSAVGTLALIGLAGKVRSAVLIEGEPLRQQAVVENMPSGWRERFGPCADVIGGMALLADGTRAALIEVPLGVATPHLRAAAVPETDTAHLLVRAGRAQMEAVRVATLQGITALDKVPGIAILPTPGRAPRRMLLSLGGEGEVIAVDEIVGLAPQGRVERVGGLRFLVTDSGRYRLLEPSDAQPVRASRQRVLVTAPEGPDRTALRDLVRSLGHEVSLADDPRAARLMGGRFDVILFDLSRRLWRSGRGRSWGGGGRPVHRPCARSNARDSARLPHRRGGGGLGGAGIGAAGAGERRALRRAMSSQLRHTGEGHLSHRPAAC
ncbi:chemotaxis protein CheW [Ancylobacter sp.]|uniref:chemotaxis protein CheW n=1 Tax=Ancylobacter sp. TaxID=1872567 RepID=UPI003D0A4856